MEVIIVCMHNSSRRQCRCKGCHGAYLKSAAKANALPDDEIVARLEKRIHEDGRKKQKHREDVAIRKELIVCHEVTFLH